MVADMAVNGPHKNVQQLWGSDQHIRARSERNPHGRVGAAQKVCSEPSNTANDFGCMGFCWCQNHLDDLLGMVPMVRCVQHVSGGGRPFHFLFIYH